MPIVKPYRLVRVFQRSSFACNWVREAKIWYARPACQTLAFLIGYFGQGYQASVLRVERVHTKATDYAMSNMCQMHAYLVGATSF